MKRYLVGHDIAKQHDMSRVNDHVVTFHGILNLIDDGTPGCLDTEHLSNLNDVIR